MFGFNRNRVKYEYCELIESDLEKLYQKEHNGLKIRFMCVFMPKQF
ncbi:hypothetical protein [Helicobacter bilis]|nr:hypothetical protein [Helicobacter bilis]